MKNISSVNKYQNKIMCIKSEILFRDGTWKGMLPKKIEKTTLDIIINKFEFRVRDKIEEDPNYIQIITHAYISYEGKLFLHREKYNDDKRNHNIIPLGYGGHIEQFDYKSRSQIIDNALNRELKEEVIIGSNIISKKLLGLFYVNDEIPINKYHMGIIYIIDLDGDKVHSKEEGMEDLGFKTLGYLNRNINKLTTWSQYAVKYLKSQQT